MSVVNLYRWEDSQGRGPWWHVGMVPELMGLDPAVQWRHGCPNIQLAAVWRKIGETDGHGRFTQEHMLAVYTVPVSDTVSVVRVETFFRLQRALVRLANCHELDLLQAYQAGLRDNWLTAQLLEASA